MADVLGAVVGAVLPELLRLFHHANAHLVSVLCVGVSHRKQVLIARHGCNASVDVSQESVFVHLGSSGQRAV